MSKISLRYVCSNLVNFQSGSKVYIVEPSLVLRNTNKDLNFTFTVGWGWVGGKEQRPVIWRSSGQLSGRAAASYLEEQRPVIWYKVRIMLTSAKLS